MNLIAKKSDFFGVMSSTLCFMHCLLTPVLFVIPFWWKGMNFVFVAVSLLAVYFSSKNTSRSIMKPLLWIGFFLLSFCIINEEIGFFHLPEIITYFAAINLAGLHVYNLKFCQCDDDQCCPPDA